MNSSYLKCNLHTHTLFCDGENTAREIAEAALALKMTDIGFSGHSSMPSALYEGWSMKREEEYIKEILALKGEYAGRINIYLGMEVDAQTDSPNLGKLDYTIGSVHQKVVNGKIYAYDNTRTHLDEMISEVYNGDAYAMTEEYFIMLTNWICKLKPDIVGHFDLPKKFNYTNVYIDESNPKYRSAALCCVDECMKATKLFEVNTGNLARGLGNAPYPSQFILKHIRERGGSVIINSDAHKAENLLFAFSEAAELCRSCGFSEITVMENGKFIRKPL